MPWRVTGKGHVAGDNPDSFEGKLRRAVVDLDSSLRWAGGGVETSTSRRRWATGVSVIFPRTSVARGDPYPEVPEEGVRSRS